MRKAKKVSRARSRRFVMVRDGAGGERGIERERVHDHVDVDVDVDVWRR